jgi:pimeloyl-ACP methyl ester carboxylesterase
MSEAKVRRTTIRNSTSVLFVRLMRASLRLQVRFAPRRAEARAARLFCTPLRSRSGREPRLPDRVAERRVRRVGAYDVVSWTWGAGPEVLLVHGWDGRASQLETIATRLLAEGYKVTAIELPAHGATSGRTATVVDFAKAIRAVAEERSGVHAVVAHSLGGMAAAIALIDRPFAAKAVLLAPARDPKFFVRHAAAFMGIPEDRVFGMCREIEARAGRTLDELDLRRQAGAIDLPLLVLHDEGDQDVPIEHGEAVSKVSTRGVFEWLSGLGHRRLLRDPAVVERIVAFLGQADARQERNVQ